jgi:uncharacterized protein DUF3891/uncharacterized protein DUF3153
MILQDRGDHLLVIRQTDHAILSGFLAREWGNECFRKPDMFESFCLAAREHDNGWAEWELQPRIDPKARIPFTFMSIPTEQHIAFYQRGIERVVQVDSYAGLLVSMHCAGLYDRARATLPGFSAKYVKSGELRLVNEFMQYLKAQQLRLKADLRMNPATKSLAEEESLERSARLLDALDRLSLYFCLRPPKDASIEAVPASEEGGNVDWELRVGANNYITLAPYAFRRTPLSIGILARKVPNRLYGDQDDFHRELSRSSYFALEYTLQAAHAAMNERHSAVA